MRDVVMTFFGGANRKPTCAFVTTRPVTFSQNELPYREISQEHH